MLNTLLSKILCNIACDILMYENYAIINISKLILSIKYMIYNYKLEM